MACPVVELSDGKLKGTIGTNYKGEEIYAFLGIPYGKPPVGELRFQAPLPAESWIGIKDATQDGNRCYQRDMLTQTYSGAEDCLYLNVFTRNISEIEPVKPVLVFIHGGAFSMGSNNSKMFSPNFLLTEDIVFVTINYRLGILGFLRLNDPSLGVPGNAGLKDQVLALKWIQKNIKKFGGDPNNVTIYGESAGSVSVNFHVISPLSKGLFHKAIMQSGSVLNPWPYLRPNCLEVMKFLKNDCKNEVEILEMLRSIPVHNLVEAQNKLAETQLDDKLRLFGPCVEKPNETAFLTRNPIDVIISGDYNKVPMIIGYNSNEGLIILLNEMKSGSPPNPEIQYEHFVPQQMNLPKESELRKEICEKLKNNYSSEKSGDRFLIVGDAFFLSGIIGVIENFANTCPEPIYFHKLSLCTSLNGFRNIIKTQEPGVCHGDDLWYFFDRESPTNPKIPIVPGSIEEKAKLRYARLWGNFVKYGNPTPDENEFGLSWRPVAKDTLYCMDVDEELSLKINPEGERMKLWKTIYKSHSNTKNFML